MKKYLCLLLVLVSLCGCSKQEDGIDIGLRLRERLLGKGCEFDARITADFGEMTYDFVLGCEFGSDGNMIFVVKEPQTIAGISGTISATGGRLTFDDKALSFPLLAQGEISPISCPWLLIRGLYSGYLAMSAKEGQDYRVTIQDSFAEDSLRVDVWLNDVGDPQKAEIIWKDRCVVTIFVENFHIL